MGWAYSVDLRERVVAAFDAEGMTDEQVAAFFKVGEATVHRWKRLKRETGTLEHKPFGGGMPPRVGPQQHDLVREIVREKPDLTVQEVAWEFHRRAGQSVSRAAMGRTLLKLGLTRKQKDVHRGPAKLWGDLTSAHAIAHRGIPLDVSVDMSMPTRPPRPNQAWKVATAVTAAIVGATFTPGSASGGR